MSEKITSDTLERLKRVGRDAYPASLREGLTPEQVLNLDPSYVTFRGTKKKLERLKAQKGEIEAQINELQQYMKVCDILNKALTKSNEIFMHMIDAHYNPDGIVSMRNIVTRLYGDDNRHMYIQLRDIGLGIERCAIDDESTVALASLLGWEAVNDTGERKIKIRYLDDCLPLIIERVLELSGNLVNLRQHTAQLWISNKCIQDAEAEPVITLFGRRLYGLQRGTHTDTLQPQLCLVVNGNNIPKNRLVRLGNNVRFKPAPCVFKSSRI